MKKNYAGKEHDGKNSARIYNRIVDALKTQYFEAGLYEVIQPVCLHQVVKQDNTLIQLNKGTLMVDEETQHFSRGEFYFVPAGKRFTIKHGKTSAAIPLTSDGYPLKSELQEYFRPVTSLEDQSEIAELYSMVSFGSSLYDAASFFNALDLPPIRIPFDRELSFLVKQICMEQELNKIGRRTLIENYVQEIVIHICRYLDSLPQLEKNIERVEYLLDKRLVDIVLYVQNNLEKDLSNKSIASIAYVSEDYVGQFFKTLTGRNLQDYVEDQRLEKAMYMLRTSSTNVQNIARSVGFRDPAYFSRRFKNKFGENANAVRHEASYSM